jgi:hypothetical protein
MPIKKHAYCHCRVEPSELLVALLKLDLLPASEFKSINRAFDATADSLEFEILRRWTKPVRTWVDETGEFSLENQQQEKLLEFKLRDGIMQMPSTRSIKQLAQVMAGNGLADVPLALVNINLVDWLKATLMAHDGSQLGGLTLHGFPADNQLMGKFDAKSFDNRVHMDYISVHAHQLTSVKIGWFDDGIKHSVQVSANGKLECGCKDPDMLLDHYDRERKLMLKYA